MITDNIVARVKRDQIVAIVRSKQRQAAEAAAKFEEEHRDMKNEVPLKTQRTSREDTRRHSR